MTPDLKAKLLDLTRVPLPLPGGGATVERWLRLAQNCDYDIAIGRLVEAHADADAILHEIVGQRVEARQLWGVWAAEPPHPLLTATRQSGRWRLDGTKLWCSGASICTHALVTASDGGESRLYAVDLNQTGVRPRKGTWVNAGMRVSDTEPVDFTNVQAEPVGDTTSYLDRPGFWYGAAGVAACWYGGAVAVAEPLKARLHKANSHQLAHMGAIDAALAGARWALVGAAGEVDNDPHDHARQARIRALRVRTIVENAATQVIDGVGRALGAGPLCQDERHAQRVADLSIYVRQSHAESDLAALGGLLA
ncbi:hypothetical protein CLV47_106127 [Antricoccus suffuscus]|uniref:Acyl-CoA dehydrogenase n=1 Tax=Antricoccus suffuscus TaxID=1629062 RepID=A0A2T1A0X8_9ACTN|nr:acyl-CoA dehydrogenase [Antricoccus suffuscus]PRZ42256.1 hypothetical protein CLV47_106127 [Antricoccus suffuscus]